MSVERRRMLLAGGIKEPIFRLDFSNGLTPDIAPSGTTVTSAGTVNVYQGLARFVKGQLTISPAPFPSGDKTWHIKHRQTYLLGCVRHFQAFGE